MNEESSPTLPPMKVVGFIFWFSLCFISLFLDTFELPRYSLCKRPDLEFLLFILDTDIYKEWVILNLIKLKYDLEY